eukprot:TRINITY_DN1561_c0_g1_i13.p1 TRINITY_DN1561_c0_g1~~TRINITY_DN1561_c0_g1_i13.p1  ORF type:complete len:668 (+),score=75.07 TRINITY_DN1561_c0_g1_i13:183-2186(+)
MASSPSFGSALGTRGTLNTHGLEAIPESDAVVGPDDMLPKPCAESWCERASTDPVLMDTKDAAMKDRIRVLEDRMERLSNELVACRSEQEDAVDRLGQLTVSVAESMRKALQRFEKMIDARCTAIERDLSRRWEKAETCGSTEACESEGHAVQSSENAVDAIHTEGDIALADKAALGQASRSLAQGSKTCLRQASSSLVESSTTGLLQASFLAESSSSKVSDSLPGQASFCLAQSSKKSAILSESLGKLSQAIEHHCKDLFDFADGTPGKQDTNKKEVPTDEFSAAASLRSRETPLAGSAGFSGREDTCKIPTDEFSGTATPHTVSSPPAGSAEFSSASEPESAEAATLAPECPSCTRLAGSADSSSSRVESPKTAALTSEYPSHAGSFVSTRVRSRSTDKTISPDACCDHRFNVQLPAGPVSPNQFGIAQEFRRCDLQAEVCVAETRCHEEAFAAARENAESGRVVKSTSTELLPVMISSPQVRQSQAGFRVQPPPTQALTSSPRSLRHATQAPTSSPRSLRHATQAQPRTCMSALCIQESMAILPTPGGSPRASGPVSRKTMPPRLYARISGAQAPSSNSLRTLISRSSGAWSAPLSGQIVGTVPAHLMFPSKSPSQQGTPVGSCEAPVSMAPLSTLPKSAGSKLPKQRMLSGPSSEVPVLLQSL